ncbi:MAG: hypothetical protein RLP44_15680 [Aggregatilineales bacterium]
MRRSILLLLLALFIFPLAVSAQDDNVLLFDLSETYTDEELSLEFPYPADWVFDDSTETLYMAENEADLAAELDDDETTNAEGYTITLGTIPVAALQLENPTLDEAVDIIVAAVGLNITETVEVPIMTRRSIVVIGVDEDGEAGLASMWLQNGLVVVFSMGTPEDEVSGDTGFSFGNIIGAMLSLPAEGFELTEVQELPDFGVAINYPTGWIAVTTETGVRFYETEEDAANDASGAAPVNYAVAFLFTNVSEMGLPEGFAYSDFPDLAQTLFEPTEIFSIDEHVILDIPGILLVGASELQATAAGIFLDGENDRALVVGVSAPDPQALTDFQSTGIAMFQSLRLME